MNTRQNKRNFVEVIVGILVTVLGLYVYIGALDYPKLPGNDYGSALFPKIIGTFLFVGGMIAWTSVLLRVLRQRLNAQELREMVAIKSQDYRVFLPVILVLAYAFLAEYIGAIITLGIIMFLMFLSNKIRVGKAIIISIIASVVVWLAFAYMLKVPLPLGFLNG